MTPPFPKADPRKVFDALRLGEAELMSMTIERDSLRASSEVTVVLMVDDEIVERLWDDVMNQETRK